MSQAEDSESGSETDDLSESVSEAESPDVSSNFQVLSRITSSLSPALQENLERAHRKVSPIPIDVLGSLGADAPILVDGTALFREVGWNPYLDWSHGGQVLQCVYQAERILKHVLEKDVRLEIFFFKD